MLVTFEVNKFEHNFYSRRNSVLLTQDFGITLNTCVFYCNCDMFSSVFISGNLIVFNVRFIFSNSFILFFICFFFHFFSTNFNFNLPPDFLLNKTVFISFFWHYLWLYFVCRLLSFLFATLLVGRHLKWL